MHYFVKPELTYSELMRPLVTSYQLPVTDTDTDTDTDTAYSQVM